MAFAEWHALGPEQGGDLNGDGIDFNDRVFVFSVEKLPLAAEEGTAAAVTQKLRYARYLAEHECVSEYIGQIIPRNTCRNPWFNRLDVRIAKTFQTFGGQEFELQIDLFNVLNGLNEDWGEYRSVFGSNRNLMTPVRFDAESGKILYRIPPGFGQAEGFSGLLLQFQAQIGVEYRF